MPANGGQQVRAATLELQFGVVELQFRVIVEISILSASGTIALDGFFLF